MTPRYLRVGIEKLRQMSGTERLAISFQLCEEAREKERTRLRTVRPDWNHRRVLIAVTRTIGLAAGIPPFLLLSPEEDEPIIVYDPAADKEHGT